MSSWISLRNAADKSRTQLGLANLNPQMVRDRPTGFFHTDLRPPQRGARRRRDFAGKTDEAQRVAAVRLDVHVQDDIAVQIGEMHSQPSLGGQDQDPLGIAGDVQFVA